MDRPEAGAYVNGSATAPSADNPGLVPEYIVQAQRERRRHGSLVATAMFLDISGFTPMTRALMSHGRQGAEAVSAILNAVFEPLIQIVYGQGGFVAAFAGDAMTILFPEPTVGRPLAAAQAIQRLMHDRQAPATELGTFPITVKLGLAHGEVEWGIVGPSGHLTSFFRGRAIDRAAEAEAQAASGEVIVDRALLALQPAGRTQSEPLGEGYARLLGLGPHAPVEDHPLPTQAAGPLDAFYPGTLLGSLHAGEFRDVAAVFLPFRSGRSFDELDALITQAIQGADRFGGYLNCVNFGDKGSYMLFFFGAPVAYENTLERVLSFLGGLRTDLCALPEGRPDDWRAGVTFGRAFAGLVGARFRADYVVSGDVVNLAARLAMAADWGEIRTDGQVARKPTHSFQYLGDLDYKGFAFPVASYRFLGEKPAERQFFREALVGRATELHRLVAAAEPLYRGDFAGVAYVYGEPGIGKSRLAYELRSSLDDRSARGAGPAVRWFVAQTDQTLRQPFNPFAYVLRQYFEQSPEEPPAANKARFEAHLAGLLSEVAATAGSEGLSEALARSSSFLGALVGLSWPGSPYESLDARGRFEATIEAVRNFLLGQARGGPCILEIEDIQWLDDASQALISALVPEAGGYPLLILATSRYADDGSRPHFQLGPGIPQLGLELHALAPSDVRGLADGVLSERLAIQPPSSISLDDAAFATLLERTEANPFYVQQLLYYFAENGLLDAQPAGTQTVVSLKGSPSDLPSSINALLVARIDRLEPRVKESVKVAAVLGREFELRILGELMGSVVAGELAAAVDGQIWVRVSEARYAFQHVLLHDAAYNMQAGATLRQLHQRAGDAEEKAYAANLAPFYADLAYHYGRAQAEDCERQYTRLAGEQAASRFASNDAVRYLERAIELQQRLPATAENIGGEIQLQLTLGSFLLATRGQGSPEMKRAYDRARELCRQLGEVPQIAAVLFGLTAFYLFRGEFATAADLAEQSIRIAERSGDADLMMEAHFSQSAVLYWMGRPGESEAHAQRVLALYRPGEHQDHVLRFAQAPWISALMFDSYSKMALGYPEQALSIALDSLRQAQEMGLPFNIAIALQVVGWIYWMRREPGPALEYARELLSYASENHFPQYIGFALLLAGWALVQLGQFEPGMAQLQGGIQGFRMAGSPFATSLCSLLLADSYRCLGRPEPALEEVEKGLTWANQSREVVLLSELYRQKGELLLALAPGGGAPAPVAAAESWIERALAVAREQGAFLFMLRAAASLVRLRQAHGTPEQVETARAALRVICESLVEGFDTPDLSEAAVLLAG